jgi:hypothetical protein
MRYPNRAPARLARQARANEIMTRVRAGEKLATIAKDMGVSVSRVSHLKQYADGEILGDQSGDARRLLRETRAEMQAEMERHKHEERAWWER